MKIRFLPGCLVGFLLVGTIGGCDKAPFPVAKARFFCDKDKTGIPTTFVETAKDTQPVIRWKSEIFKDSGYDPQTRCQQVSPKFQQASDNGRLRYLISDKQNNLPVICISDAEDKCDLMLFTVTPPDTVQTVLSKLQPNASKPLQQSGGGEYYLPMKELGK